MKSIVAEPRGRANPTKPLPGVKTPAEVKAEFARKGISVSKWAQQHKVHRQLVYEILSGRIACLRGESHRVAVLLGLKQGEITPANDTSSMNVVADRIAA